MGNNGINIYQVKVEVKRKGSRHFSSHIGMYIENAVVKMFHIDAPNGDKAMQKASKHGRPISCRKVTAAQVKEKRAVAVESLPLGYGLENPYPDAIAMDEMIWRKKDKRAERLNNRQKDKDRH